ncbi:MAG TPA: bifunctional phosphoribosyl-AMP cyclohydrolase/phosphoribosyl-ATP diphosphatase HisIE [Labilithrix sp.]
MSLVFDSGLIPVVAQDRVSGEIRMVAFANAEAVRRTLESGKATFFSRSRGELWEKGQTSGNAMDVSAVLVDCDADCLVYLVAPRGPTCHTGAATCFFRRLAPDGTIATDAVPTPTALARLEAVIEARKQSTASASYVKSLFDGGAEKIGGKLREEADELARAVASESDDRVVSEAADVVFHILVALRSRSLPLDLVLRELDRRS